MGILWRYSVIVVVRGKSLPTYIAYVHNFVYINSTNKRINEFTIGYIVNPTLHDNKVFI